MSSAENDMPAPESMHDRLRTLAVEDPKEAKNLFLAIFDANSAELHELLNQLEKPNEGRLRQVVANAVRSHPEKGRLVSELLKWRTTETDEFTRRAIEGALADVDIRAAPRSGPAPSELADVYRYVAGRLRHRLRNTMLSAQGQASRLRKLLAAEQIGDVQTALAKLDDAIIRLGHELEATDVDPDYFQQRIVVLPDWLERLNLQYAAKFSPISLRLVGADREQHRVLGNDYFLETIFWNIWLNSHQAVGANCEITIVFQSTGQKLELLVSDNGQGFPAELKYILFQQVYSTQGASRGRGMLEIQDAVEQLHGQVDLHTVSESEYRIRIILPREIQ